jgi:hypothetical protein
MKIEDTEYHKIETLFDRDERFKVIEGKYRLPEFWAIAEWEVSEKVDGTNIRVIYTPIHEVTGHIGLATMRKVVGHKVVFKGRKEKSQIPAHLLEYLQKTFTLTKFQKAFPDLPPTSMVVVYGEGYGEKIQDIGHHYTGKGVKFRAFDVFIEDHENPYGGWWLESENVKDVASKLGIETVPIFGGTWTTDQIVNWIKNGLETDHAFSVVQMEDNDNIKQDIDVEGIIAKSKPMLFNRKGKRVMFKLKLRDFREGKK